MNRTFRARVPASTANLGPGFDCLGLALQLYNHVSVSASSTGQHQITATGESADNLGAIESNIAFIAVQRLCKYLQVESGLLHLHLENEVPFARGLGSSSAARVGALVAANAWLENRFGKAATRDELLRLSSELEGHPDNVAAALLGGLTVSMTTAENTFAASRFEIAAWPHFVVFIPDTHLETKTARAVLPQQVSRADAIFNLSATALLLATLQNGEWKQLSIALQDRLHQTQRAALIPAFGVLHLALQNEEHCLGVTISGAGPTVLVWLHPDVNVLQVLARENIYDRFLATRFLLRVVRDHRDRNRHRDLFAGGVGSLSCLLS